MQNKNPIVMLLLAVALFGFGYYIGGNNMKIKMLEKGTGITPTAQNVTPTPAENALSKENLIKYSTELKLDTKKIEKCLTDKKYADWIKKSTSYGQEVGILGTPSFYINGRLLGGAFPIENFKEIIDKELAGTGSDDPTTYSKTLQDAAKQSAFNPVQKDITINSDTPVRGDKNATVTIVEFSDPSCPYCIRASATIEELFTQYAGKIKMAFYYFPGHGTGEEAMQAMLCAGDQGKFWEMYSKVFTAQEKVMGL